MSMHSSKSIGMAAGALANQVRAGLPMNQAVERLQEQQPDKAEFWGTVARHISNGNTLSSALGGHWPQGFVAAVAAGEESGEIVKVLNQIEDTIRIEGEMKKHAMQLAYPVMMVLAGLGVFIFFMAFVLPSLARSLKGKGTSNIMELAFWMESMVNDHGLIILAALVIGVFLFVGWIKTPAARQQIMGVMLDVPILGPALVNLSFGLWSYYMAVMSAAGVDTVRSFEITTTVLPEALQPAIRAIHRDLLKNRGLPDASDPKKQPVGDPRKVIPFYIAIALKIAHETGEIDVELTKVAPSLIKDGVEKLNRAVSIANIIALAIAAAAIMTPLGAYYLQLFSNIRTVG